MEAWMDEWKIYLWEQQRTMQAIIDHPVPGYEEVCFDEKCNDVSE